MAQQLELGMISSTWLDTKIGLEEGVRKAKEIGFDSHDIFEDRWFPQAIKGTMGQLMRAVHKDAEPEISGRTTLRTMALVEAAYRSGREGRAVPLSETMRETVAP